MERAIRQPRPMDWPSILTSAVLAAAYMIFAWAHFSQWNSVGRPVGLGLVVQELVVVVLFVTRRRSRATSRSVVAWLATGLGTCAMLATRPGGEPLAGLGALYFALQFVGVAVAIFSLWSLGRSFGLVPANRGIQTGGTYRFVRHPIYAGYLIGQIGYILENPTLWNVGVFVVAWAFQLVRISQEEEFLRSDPAYVEYCTRVRNRLIPFVY